MDATRITIALSLGLEVIAPRECARAQADVKMIETVRLQELADRALTAYAQEPEAVRVTTIVRYQEREATVQMVCAREPEDVVLIRTAQIQAVDFAPTVDALGPKNTSQKTLQFGLLSQRNRAGFTFWQSGVRA